MMKVRNAEFSNVGFKRGDVVELPSLDIGPTSFYIIASSPDGKCNYIGLESGSRRTKDCDSVADLILDTPPIDKISYLELWEDVT